MVNHRSHSRIPWVVVSLIVMSIATASCTKRTASKSDKKEASKTVRVQTITRKDIIEVLEYPADLTPYLEVRILSPIADRIVSFPWSEGEEIKRGQRIATIYKAGLDRGLDRVMAESDALDVEIENLQSELNRSTTLHASGAVSDQALDQLKTRLSSVKARRRALLASQEQIAVNLRNAVLTAPISGVIVNKMLEEGDMATPGIPLCRVVQIDKLKLSLSLIELDIAKVRVGQKVKVHLNAFPDRIFQGEVHKILPYINPATRTNTVEVLLNNPVNPETGEKLLKPGMYGRAEITLGKREQVLVVPEKALLLDAQTLGGQKEGEILRKAFTVDDSSIAHARVVKVGARRGSEYEVLEGLKADEKIVVRGQHGLRDGQHVEVVEAEK